MSCLLSNFSMYSMTVLILQVKYALSKMLGHTSVLDFRFWNIHICTMNTLGMGPNLNTKFIFISDLPLYIAWDNFIQYFQYNYANCDLSHDVRYTIFYFITHWHSKIFEFQSMLDLGCSTCAYIKFWEDRAWILFTMISETQMLNT